MLELDLVLFQALNADAATLPAVVTVARWVSQQLPTAMGGLLLGSLVLGNAEQRRSLALALASMALAWIGVQLLRLAFPMPRPAQLGLGIQWIEHAARAGFPSMHVAGAAALAASLLLRPITGLTWLTWLAAVVTAAMLWSRVCLGVHFPSDVLAGLLTGGLAAAAIHALAARAPRLQALLHKSPQGNAH
ncbi:undecaprenyl-diphosphatase [Acidovorax sp. 107]|uniref:phosphatase PAP2 family protein n=1 Tax=Acidovorax sp. 107 TaxID=2135638 RepID=UPI000D34C8E1|nr:phosphatase PAP2 family protein [Acidovorax sp. 107]PUA97862.1 undecaprenyl-diphosphatase [Acidovorax sp. 107]